MEMICFPAGEYEAAGQRYRVRCLMPKCTAKPRRIVANLPVETTMRHPRLQPGETAPAFKECIIEPCLHREGYGLLKLT